MSSFPFYFLNNYMFFIVFLFWHSFLNAGDDVFFDSLPSGKIFYKTDKQYDNFQLVSGSVRYLRTDEGAEGDLSPDFRTMTKMRFPVNLTGWRSQHEEAIQR